MFERMDVRWKAALAATALFVLGLVAGIAALLDSLRVEVRQAAEFGPESLQVAARRARRELEQAIPVERRPEFNASIRDHHARRMMRHMRRGGMQHHGPMMGPMMRPDTGHRQMMRPPGRGEP